MTAAALELRPLTLGEIIDRAVRLYRQNFVNFIGIIALVQVPLSIFQLMVTAYNLNNPVNVQRQADTYQQLVDNLSSSGYLDRAAIQVLLTVASFILVQGVATAALTRAIADNYLGRKTDMLEAYSRLGGAWVRLIGVLILMVLLCVILFIWLIVPCVGWISGPGLLVYVAMVVSPLLAPVVVLENLGTGAIRRAWDLVRRRFWWALGFMVILVIFNQIITAGPSMVATLFLQYALKNQSVEYTNLIQTLVQALVGLGASLFYLPIQLGAITLMYLDLRVRTEGFDLAVLAGATAGQDMVDLTGQASTAAPSPLITGNELGNFVLISILGIGGICLVSYLLQALFLSMYGF